LSLLSADCRHHQSDETPGIRLAEMPSNPGSARKCTAKLLSKGHVRREHGEKPFLLKKNIRKSPAANAGKQSAKKTLNIIPYILRDNLF
jgi:hypothetical protein